MVFSASDRKIEFTKVGAEVGSFDIKLNQSLRFILSDASYQTISFKGSGASTHDLYHVDDRVLELTNGTAPTASATNGVLLYSQDVSSSSELKVRDEAGNITTLSPHNFSKIPEGASNPMAWSYYSEKNGDYVNIDMYKLAELVEKVTGEKLIYTGKV